MPPGATLALKQEQHATRKLVLCDDGETSMNARVPLVKSWPSRWATLADFGTDVNERQARKSII